MAATDRNKNVKITDIAQHAQGAFPDTSLCGRRSPRAIATAVTCKRCLKRMQRAHIALEALISIRDHEMRGAYCEGTFRGIAENALDAFGIRPGETRYRPLRRTRRRSAP